MELTTDFSIKEGRLKREALPADTSAIRRKITIPISIVLEIW